MEIRPVTSELEVRSPSERLLCGIVVPFGVDQRIDESLVERFERGAFTRQLRAKHRVLLRDRHSTEPASMPLGHAKVLREDPAGLYGEFRVAEGNMGDHYLSLAREGSLHQWSIGFNPEASRMDGRTTVRTRVTILETALVPEGAYGELAAVGAVRAAIPVLTRDTLLARLPKPHFPA
jgi:uncharacterized protein